MEHAALHARARDKGVNPLVYWLVRAVLQPFFHLYFRLSRIGREHVPRRPGDPRLQPPLVPRPVRHRHDRPAAAVLRRQEGAVPQPLHRLAAQRLGAFPVDRGDGDEDMIDTAKAILARGDAVADLPRGHAHPPGRARPPKRGVGRLALETGAPVVPVAVIGTEAIRKGWRIRPHKVRIRVGAPAHLPAGRRRRRARSPPPSPTASGPA